MVDMPRGTVTFLFTDIEGSTKRWDKNPDQMSADLRIHDSLLREAIESNGGFVFKTVGDAFCAAFPTALSALHAVMAAQRSLAEYPWGGAGPVRVRMALHTGAAEERDGDYFGPPLNRVARLLSAGYGGQTLLSRATEEMVCDTLPAGASLNDLGEHRLKDLQRPEHVFQLVTPDIPRLPAEFPPLKTLDSRPNNLPAQPTPLIGRERDLESARNLLLRDEVRLVALTGPGGVGKTRLGMQIAADVMDYFEDGVFLIALAPTRDPELVASAIAQTLGVREAGGRPLDEALAEYLWDKRLLLLLDNFEQLVEAAPLLAGLLSGSPGTKLLVTSREVLHLRGEHEYPVPPLPAPDPRRAPATPDADLASALAQYEAVRLFVDRATAAKPGFELTNANARAVAEICHRLDGLPLAIELAAARIRLFPPQAMLARLQNRLHLLTGGPRDLPARQQTLRDAITWSYDLLKPDEQTLFGRLSVFAGGCTVEAAEAVCNGTDDGRWTMDDGVNRASSLPPSSIVHRPSSDSLPPLELDVVDGIASLVDKSLLRQEERIQGEPCFVMLETIREYGLERLAESGELAATRQAHAGYYLGLAEEAEPQLRGPEQRAWLDRLDAEHDNLRAATSWAGSAPDAADIELRLVAALWRFWYARGYPSEGHWQLQDALTKSSAIKSPVRAKALLGSGRLAILLGDYALAHSLIEQSLALSRELEDRRGIASALNDLGNVVGLEGDSELRRQYHEQGLEIFEELGDRQGIADALFRLGNVEADAGNPDTARSLLEQSLHMMRPLGDKRFIALALMVLGNVALDQADFQAARARYEEALPISRELGDLWITATLLVNLGEIAQHGGDLTSARFYYEGGLQIFRQMSNNRGVANALSYLGQVARDQGDYPSAHALFAQGLAIRVELGDKRTIAESLEALAGAWAGMGQPQRAAVLLGAADTLREAARSPVPAIDQAAYNTLLSSVRGTLGDTAWNASWAEGRAMPLDRAVTYATDSATRDN